jgi:hypothetical protein
MDKSYFYGCLFYFLIEIIDFYYLYPGLYDLRLYLFYLLKLFKYENLLL